MNCFTLIVSLFAVTIEGQISPKNPLEQKILIFLTKWQAANTQQDLLPLPSLKSVKIPPVEYYYDGKGIKLNYSIGEMQLIGLDGFSIENLYATENTSVVSLTLRFPVLTLTSDTYKLNGKAYFFYPLKGAGKMKLILRDTVITAVVQFDTTDGNTTRIRDFLINFDVKQIEADLQNSSWPINQVLNSEGVEILAGYNGTIVEALWNYVVPIVNDYLVGVPPSQLLQIIN